MSYFANKSGSGSSIVSSGYQIPVSGAVDGVNATFVWALAPNAIIIDGVIMQKNTNGTPSVENWTGTTTTILATAPNGDIFAVA